MSDGTVIRHSYWYRAVCLKCSHVIKTNDRSEFLSPFFLPDYCAGCGNFISSREFSNPDVETECVHMCLVSRPFNFWRPSTWFAEWQTVHPQHQQEVEA